jgi:hypothetical protein
LPLIFLSPATVGAAEFDFDVLEMVDAFAFEFEAEFVDIFAGLFDIAFEELFTELLGIDKLLFVMLLFEMFVRGRFVLFVGAPPHAKLRIAIAKTISTRIKEMYLA